MSKHFYVYSTMSAAVRYCAHETVEGRDLPIPVEGIVIAGGTGVADKKTLVTPTGAVPTRVTEEQLEALKGDRVFAEHLANGFLTVSEHKADGEAVASDMKSRDASAPITPQDYEAEGKEAPSAGAVSAQGDKEAPRNPRKA